MVDILHDPRVLSVLERVNISPKAKSPLAELMNLTLHCLGTIRLILLKDDQQRENQYCETPAPINRDVALSRNFVRSAFVTALTHMTKHILNVTPLEKSDITTDLIESYPNLTSLQGSDWHPLLWALCGNICVDNANEKQDDASPVIQAICNRHPKLRSDKDIHGSTALHYAARMTSVGALKSILATSADIEPAAVTNTFGQTPLHQAAAFSTSPRVVEFLHHVNSDAICTKDVNGALPLHMASALSHSPTVISTLLSLSPEAIRERANNGKLPIHGAAINPCVGVVEVVASAYPESVSLPSTKNTLPLHLAAAHNKSEEVVKYLYVQYPDAIRLASEGGALPLHWAALYNDSPGVFSYLLSVYKDAASLPTNNGWLPLHCLVSCPEMTKNRLKCMFLLLRAYPEALHYCDSEGSTPYDIARDCNHGEIVTDCLLVRK